MHYVIQYLDATGDTVTLKIDAGSREEARWLSRIPERRILSVREDLIGRIAFAIEPPGPDVKNQAVFLQSLSSALATGKTVRQAVQQLVQKSRWIRYRKDCLNTCETLADYLVLFRFNPFAILMARAAEKSGQYAESLRTAARFLIDREKIRSEVSTEFRTGVVYILMGLAFFFSVPAFLSNALEGLMRGNNQLITPNGFTHVLLAFGTFTKAWWWTVPLAAAFLLLYRAPVWRVLKRLPLFALLEQKARLDRSVEFLSVYDMLHRAGYVDADIVLELVQSSRGSRRVLYQRIYAHLAKSEDLGSALDEDDWDQTIRDGMVVLHEIDAEQQSQLIAAMRETLHLQNVHVARQIARALGRLGFILMMLAAVSAVLGFYLPLAGAAGNVMRR